MKNTLETRLGIFFAVALVATAVVLEMAGGFDVFRQGVIFSARFDNVQELKPGDPVKMAGKQIGRVHEIEFADRKVLVRMKVTDGSAMVRTDSIATIRFSGLLGQNFVSIDFGTEQGVPATTGSELATVTQPDVGEILTKIEGVASGIQRLTDNLSDVNIEEFLVPLTDFLQQSGPNISTMLTNLAHASSQIRSGEGTVGKLIYDDSLHVFALQAVTNLDATAEDLKVTLGDAQALVADVREGQGTLGKLITDEKLYDETTSAMTNFREIMEKVNRGTGSVGKLVNEEELIDNATLTLRKIDKASEMLEDQGPLTVLGILINPLF